MRKPPVVVITGASAGIGRAIAREYGQRGARVALIARGREGLDAAKAEIEEMGGEALAIVCDVADDQAIEEAARQVEDQLGPIDVWINNAMASMLAPVSEMQAGDFRRVTDVTYLGAVYGTLAALRRMKKRDRGTIVQVGSLLARRSIPLQSAYCAAKHALEGFTESLRCELMHDKSNVKLTMVHLPAVNTPQFSWIKTTLPKAPQPMGKIYQPEVAARAVVDAADRPRPTMLAGGSLLLPWFLQKVPPGVLDRVLAKRAVDGQQSPTEHVLAEHRHNLWVPVPGDHGAHGRFDHEATRSSMQLWANRRRRKLGLLSVALAVLTWRVRRARASRRYSGSTKP